MRRVLIADAAEEFRAELACVLATRCEVRVETDGAAVLKLLRRWKPDGVILDMTVPGLDAIELLQAMEQLEHPPAVLVTTCYINDYIENALGKRGVGYVMCKPCKAATVAERLEEVVGFYRASAARKDHRERAAAELLLKLRISAKLQGWEYLRKAIALKLTDPAQLITKQLYPAVGQVYGADGRQVERCIRTAIVNAWKHCDVQVWGQFFPPNASGEIPKPTNKEFIARLTEALDRE